MNFLPVWLIKNRPNWGTVADTDSSAIPYLQVLINKITQAMFKELEKNQTRVLASLNEQEMSNLGKSGSGLRKMIKDYLIYLSNRSDLVKQPITVLMGDPKLGTYLMALEKVVNMAFQAAGLSPIFTISTGAEKSATQSFSEKALDMETTRNKRQQRMELLKDMVEKLILMDKKHGNISFEYPDIESIKVSIPENIAVSSDDMLRRIQTEVPLGTMSKIKAVSLMNDITEDEAIKELDIIKGELEQQMDLEEKKFAESEGFKNNNPLDKGNKQV